MSNDVRQYKVRPNHAKYQPSHILYLDTETTFKKENDIEQHKMNLAWTCYYKRGSGKKKSTESWRYWRISEIMNHYIESRCFDKAVLYVFAHNIFFDLQASGFFHYFTKSGWVLDFTYDKGLTYILVIKKGKKRIKCISTTNYFPISLKKLGDLMGLPKLDVDFGKATIEQLKIYCRRDVEIVKMAVEYWLAFVKEHDMGKFTMTRAAQSFASYRHRFMPQKISFHRDEELNEFENAAYYGGRVECFERGEIKDGPFVSLDVNSMYPFVMRQNKYPSRFIYKLKNPNPRKLKKILNEYCCVAKVMINTDIPAYPIRQDNKIIFPVGVFWANLCTYGMQYANNHGHIEEVESIAVYTKSTLFVDFVDYFYPLKSRYKEAGNKIMERISKDILNSLYGKFAQKAPIIMEELEITHDGYYRDEVFNLVTGKKETVTKLFNKLTVEVDTETAKNSMIAISAHVTEYARFYLWEIIQQVGLENVLYCDTDSVKIRKKHMDKVLNLLEDKELGKLKIEEEFKHFTVNGAKDYKTEHYRKLKGVPKTATKIGDHKYRYKNFAGQSTHLRKRVDDYFIVKDIEKTVLPYYDKGITLDDGKVIPFTLAL